jgi:GDP-L-fucose synthase
MKKTDKIYVAGHLGMVGRALWRKLKEQGYENLIGLPKAHYNLTNQNQVESLFEEYQPDYVFMAAAKVGGIGANNSLRAEFIYDNIMIQSNIIHQAHLHKVKKLLFLGSSCVYPKFAEQPIKESSLMTSALEPTNSPYAIAKIAGIEMCKAYRDQYGDNFISVMPTNLYGLNDYYHEENSHVIPAIILKIENAIKNNNPNVILWGDGSPRREFLHADDLADACIFLMNAYNGSEIINIGSNKEITILDLAYAIKAIMGYKGELFFDISKPNGTPRKLLDSSTINMLGWEQKIELYDGLREICELRKTKIIKL